MGVLTSNLACQQAPAFGVVSALFAFALISGMARATPASNATPFVFAVEQAALTSPAGPGASAASLTRGPGGLVYLSWVEPAAGDLQALKFATFDAHGRHWSPARTIVRGSNWQMGAADGPTLAVQADGRLTAVWLVLSRRTTSTPKDSGSGTPRCYALLSRSIDSGATWSPPEPLSRESNAVDFVALQPLADGRLLAAWLDGRGKKTDPDNPAQLRARILGSDQPDVLVDPSVCEGCPLALTAFPDGSALLAYRGRTAGEIRDILSARFIDGQWEERRANSRDDWKTSDNLVDGPAVAGGGPRVTEAWFTAAGDEPRVLLSNSPDAGGIYTMAQRVDLGHARGRVSALLLHDGAQLVSWLENPGEDSSQPGGLYLRRYTSFGATMPPARLGAGGAAIDGFPRIALVKDFDDQGPAQIIVAFSRSGAPEKMETLLVTLPDAATLAAADSSCDCAPHGDELVGYAIRGHVAAVSPEHGVLRVSYAAVPGIMRAGEQKFKAAANVLTAVKPDSEILARIEQRNGEWWIFDVRTLVTPKP
jgi:hypothetical protein